MLLEIGLNLCYYRLDKSNAIKDRTKIIVYGLI